MDGASTLKSRLKYLVPQKHSRRSHLYDPAVEDTLCRMLSTNGIDKNRYSVYNRPVGKGICTQCKAELAKREGKVQHKPTQQSLF